MTDQSMRRVAGYVLAVLAGGILAWIGAQPEAAPKKPRRVIAYGPRSKVKLVPQKEPSQAPRASLKDLERAEGEDGPPGDVESGTAQPDPNTIEGPSPKAAPITATLILRAPRVEDPAGVGIPGVRLTALRPNVRTVFTTSCGAGHFFLPLSPGEWTIIPTRAGMYFTPPSRRHTVPAGASGPEAAYFGQVDGGAIPFVGRPIQAER